MRCDSCGIPFSHYTVTCEECEKHRVNFKLRHKPLDDLEISVRSYHCLLNLGITNVGELCQWKEADLLQCPNLGRKSLNEIKETLHQWGASLRQELVIEQYRVVAVQHAEAAQRGEG